MFQSCIDWDKILFRLNQSITVPQKLPKSKNIHFDFDYENFEHDEPYPPDILSSKEYQHFEAQRALKNGSGSRKKNLHKTILIPVVFEILKNSQRNTKIQGKTKKKFQNLMQLKFGKMLFFSLRNAAAVTGLEFLLCLYI